MFRSGFVGKQKVSKHCSRRLENLSRFDYQQGDEMGSFFFSCVVPGLWRIALRLFSREVKLSPPLFVSESL